MRNSYIFFSRILSIIILFVILQSCIKEDRSNCDKEKIDVRVSFSFSTAVRSMPFSITNPDDFNRVDLFVFDENNRFIGQWVDQNPKLDANYYISLPLSPGKYSFVAWGSLDNSYKTIPATFTPGSTRIEEAQLTLIRDQNNNIVQPPTALYYAHKLGAEVLAQPSIQQYVLPLVQNTNLINLQTEGLVTSTGDSYTFSISDNNGSYYFQNNSFAIDNTFTYQTSLEIRQQQQSQLFGSLTVLRLAEIRPYPVLSIRNETQNTTLYEANLIDLLVLLRNQGVIIDIENTHIFDIIVRFVNNSANIKVEVSINGWWVVDDNNILKP